MVPTVRRTSTATPRRDARLAGLLDDLARRSVNYSESAAPPSVVAGWHRDRRELEVGVEAPGEPERGGPFETAAALVNSYEFSDPSILRAAYRHRGDLVGRNMVLEGRFLVLRFLMGVRITERHDQVRDGPNGPERRVGWSYQTLEGHIEQGRLTYEVAKELDTGRVEFRIIANSRRGPIPNPVLRLGFRLFGRRTQLRFYRNVLERMPMLVEAPPPPPQPGPDGIVRAPSGLHPGRFEAWTIRVGR
ncbi:DUF1990 family protein [Pseudonocardia sp. DLS-67]